MGMFISGSSTSTGSFHELHIADRVGIGTTTPLSSTGFNSANLTIHGSNPSLVLSDSGQDNFQIVTHANAFKFMNDSDDRAFFIIEENAPANAL